MKRRRNARFTVVHQPYICSLSRDAFRLIISFLTKNHEIKFHDERSFDNQLYQSLILTCQAFRSLSLQELFAFVVDVKSFHENGKFNPFALEIENRASGMTLRRKRPKLENWILNSFCLNRLQLQTHLRALHLSQFITTDLSSLTQLSYLQLNIADVQDQLVLPSDLVRLVIGISRKISYAKLRQIEIKCPYSLHDFDLTCAYCSKLGALSLNDNLDTFNVHSYELTTIVGGANLRNIMFFQPAWSLPNLSRFKLNCVLMPSKCPCRITRNYRDIGLCSTQRLIIFNLPPNALELLAKWPNLETLGTDVLDSDETRVAMCHKLFAICPSFD
jgi:hypothetical protein